MTSARYGGGLHGTKSLVLERMASAKRPLTGSFGLRNYPASLRKSSLSGTPVERMLDLRSFGRSGPHLAHRFDQRSGPHRCEVRV